MKTKQTALQWFVDRLPYSIETQFSKQIQEAMQMEREQMDNVAEDWWNEGASYVYNGVKKYESFNKYYEQTYGGQDE